MIYRGIMMSGYEYAYTHLEASCHHDSFMQSDILFGLRPLVVASIVFSSLTRGIVESPIEYAKVMGQTGQKWKIRDIYRGLHFQIMRTTALLIVSNNLIREVLSNSFLSL